MKRILFSASTHLVLTPPLSLSLFLSQSKNTWNVALPFVCCMFIYLLCFFILLGHLFSIYGIGENVYNSLK